MTGGPPRRFPDALVLIGGLILLAQAATYVLPAGEFEREGRQVIRGTYQAVEAEPLPLFTFLTAVPAGLADAADVIFFILIVGGVFGVLRATGAVHALIGLAIERLGGRPALLAGGMVTLLAVGSSTVGMAEEYMRSCPCSSRCAWLSAWMRWWPWASSTSAPGWATPARPSTRSRC